MFGIKYFKADPSTYVIKSINGRVKSKGKGLSFFYQTALTSIASVPINSQECPFIFNNQTQDFQEVAVQGQIIFQIDAPEKVISLLNFNLSKDGLSFVSDDPAKLTDRISRLAQGIIQSRMQQTSLKKSLTITQGLVELLSDQLLSNIELAELGITIKSIAINRISPSKETGRALEAETREVILKEADDAIYARRKSSVEQERTIQEAELQTQLSVQQKKQEIMEKQIENKRSLVRGEYATRQEKLGKKIAIETERNNLVIKVVENRKLESDAQAYALAEQMKAFKELPVENLKALALASMNADQLMALAFDSLAQNAEKIGELNISPDLVSSFKKAVAN